MWSAVDSLVTGVFLPNVYLDTRYICSPPDGAFRLFRVTPGTVTIMVSRLELNRAVNDHFPMLDSVYRYYDYPSGTHEETTSY